MDFKKLAEQYKTELMENDFLSGCSILRIRSLEAISLA